MGIDDFISQYLDDALVKYHHYIDDLLFLKNYQIVFDILFYIMS